MNRFIFLLQDILKKIWIRCFLFCVFALGAVVVGPVLGPYVPGTLKELVSPAAVENLLQILASSMLAVTTFSLSIMVQAFSAAATTASPRTNKLLMKNSTAQNALATFIGSFLFSIVGIIAIGAKLYNEDIIVVLFFFTLIVICIIVVMLLRWIDKLSRLGRVSETIKTVEVALRESIENRASAPNLQAKVIESENFNKEKLFPIVCEDVGYVQYIDIEALDDIAKRNDIHLYIEINPGKLMDSVIPLAYATKNISEDIKAHITDAFVVGDSRTFKQDPRYGFVVLCEIALKALSPAVNDPGTAIDVLRVYLSAVRLWVNCFSTRNKESSAETIKYDSVSIASIQEEDILEDMYSPLISDAARNLHISQHIKVSLSSIAQFGSERIRKEADYWQEYLKTTCNDKLSKNDCHLLFSDD